MTTDRDDLIAEAETHYIVAKSVYENLQGSLARALLEIYKLQSELATAKADAEGWLGIVNLCYQEHMCYREEISRDRNASITAVESQCLGCDRWNDHAPDCYVLRYENMLEMDEAKREADHD